MDQTALDSIIDARRSIRLFQQKPVADATLAALIDAARKAPCATNQQKLRYVVCRTPEMTAKILPLTAWARRVAPQRTPEQGVSAPAAYIVVTAPTPVNVFLHADAGAAIMSMLLQAQALGLGACWLASVERPALMPLLNLDDSREILYVVAVGYPAETPVMDNVTDAADIGYYLDDDNVLHVPKLTVDALTQWF